MKKIYLSLLALAGLTIGANAQIFSSSFENWNTNTPPTPTDWMGAKTNLSADSITKVTSGAQNGSFAVKLQNRSGSSKRFTSSSFAIVQGTFYEIKYFAKGKGDIMSGLWTGKSPSASPFGYVNDGSYETVNTTTSWWVYTDYVMADTTTSSAEISFWVRNTIASSNHVSFDNVTVTAVTPQSKTIYDIQYSTAVNGDSPEKNNFISTSGVVTAKSPYGYFIQDGQGAWNGIYVDDQDNVGTVTIGDNVTIKGVVKEDYGQTILNVVQLTVNSSGNALPTAEWLPTNSVKQEKYEGVFVKVGNAACTSMPDTYNEWKADDGSGFVKINDQIYLFTPTLNSHYDITGVVEYSFSEYKVLPRSAADVTAATAIKNIKANDFNIYPNPSNGIFTVNFDKAGKAEIKMFDVLGKVVYTKKLESTSNAVTVNVNELPNGVYFLQIQTVEGMNTQRIVIE